MTLKFHPSLSALGFLFVLNQSFLYSQLDWQLNSEIGYYESSNNQDNAGMETDNILSRFEGQVKYNYKAEERTASVQLRLRPEFYGVKNSIYSIKLKAAGDYFQESEKLVWGLNISRQRNIYTFTNTQINYDVFLIHADAALYYLDDYPLTLSLGYAFQNLDEISVQNLDLWFAEFKFYRMLNTYFKFGYGLYLERFFIENKIRLISGDTENKGWRLGPQFTLNYLKDFILSADYRFLFHYSKYNDNPSYEQWIRLVAGKIFLTDWSIFLLVDYYTRFFSTTRDFVDSINPLYSPLNLENRVYVKVDYELTNNLKAYIKSGYFKENLYEKKFILEGWNALIGLELGTSN